MANPPDSSGKPPGKPPPPPGSRPPLPPTTAPARPAQPPQPGAPRPAAQRPSNPQLIAIPSIPPVAPGAGPLPSIPPVSAVVPSIAPLVPPVAPLVPPAAQARPAPPAPAPKIGGLDAAQRTDLEQRYAALDNVDYFQLLKLERTATPADIKKAFHRDSRVYHPDRFYKLPDAQLKERITEVYKRITEAYYVLRDDAKRRVYVADISGPERAQKLRFTEASEAEKKQAVKREIEEQIGTHPKGRQFFQAGMVDFNAERWSAAERNFKMALTFEPSNARYKEKLGEVQQKLKGSGSKI